MGGGGGRFLSKYMYANMFFVCLENIKRNRNKAGKRGWGPVVVGGGGGEGVLSEYVYVNTVYPLKDETKRQLF